MGGVTPLSIGIVWAGYTVIWYGYSLIKGPGMGLTDLILPTRVAKVNSIVAGWAPNSDDAVASYLAQGQPR